MLAQLEEQYPGQVRLAYRHFPLPQHDRARLAAQAAEAAGLQAKFWEMHDLLFTEQATWSDPTLSASQTPDPNAAVGQFEAWLMDQAPALGLDPAKFATDLKSEAVVAKVEAAYSEGVRIGIPSTPTLLINGRVYTGPRDLESLGAIVKLTELEKRQFTVCPPMQIDPQKQYLATLKTDKGDIVLQLYADKAPMAVNSFVFLARHNWFDGVTFHRVLPGFVAQAGDPSGTGYGSPGYAFDNEIVTDLKFDKPGVLGMANAGPNSNGSQFFITYAAEPTLDGAFTVFGQVIQGMDVAEKLTPRNPSEGATLPPGDKILSVTIEEK